ncbi:ribonuclease H-like domain-containing protein [Tanacetum coccineum]
MKFHHHHNLHHHHHKHQHNKLLIQYQPSSCLFSKKGEYDIWAMKMEHYLAHTDYPIWEVIQNGNGPVSITTDTSGQIKVLPPRTAEEIVARERERKARTTLLMALPEDHLAKFHKMTDAKEMWDAIKSRFGGNDESKKMQKYILKQQFEGFTVSNTEGLHKGYDRFQSLLSQLEIHGAGVSTEDANQKFLRSLPSAWSQVSLIMRTKPGVDSLSFDDLYNNLRVFESDVKGSTASSSSPQNVAFVSENTSNTNDVSTAYGVSNTFGQYTIDEYDLEKMDLKWQVAMISMRMKKFYKKTGRKLQFDAKEPVGFDKTKVECYNCHKTGHFARECRIKGNQDNRRRDAWNSRNKDGSRTGKKEDSKALVTIDGEGVDWTNHSEEDEDYALMACNSSESDTEVTSCSNKCKESYANLKKLYDAQREQLSDASIEIKAYSQGLKKVEAQLVAHQQGQLWYEQKIKFMKIDLDDKTDVLTYHKKLLAEAQKEKEDLKAKVEKWHNSSKNLSKLLNTQMSANDKFGLGYGDHRYDGILSYENEVLQSVFMNKESELEKQPLYDRFVTAGGMHVVPPPMTGNYMPSGPDIEVDYSQFTYGPKQTQPSESESQTSKFDTCESNISTEPSELVSEQVVNESNVECQYKVWSDAPIIEEYESDSEDEYVSIPTKQQETPSFANQQVKTPRETVKNQFTHSQKPKVDKKELGYGFTVRACFVCGSLNHLIRDCDFHEKRMARKAELNNKLSRNSGPREIRPIWNNVQRINKQNQFVPAAVLTRTGKIPVNTARASGTKNVSTARQSFNRQAVLTSTAMKVNTVKPIVNRVRPANVFHKTHSPSSRPFKKTTVLRTNFSKQNINTAKVNAVSAVGGKRETAVKPLASCNWRPQRYTGTMSPNTMDYPHRALKNKGIVDSGCSRPMTGNKAYLAEFQDFNGGPVAFGGEKVQEKSEYDRSANPRPVIETPKETLKPFTEKSKGASQKSKEKYSWKPMLANAHARIDVFGKKISLEVGGEKVPNGFGAHENLEEFLINDEINGNLRDFMELNDLLLKMIWNLLDYLMREDGIAITKRRHQDFLSDGVMDLATVLGRFEKTSIRYEIGIDVRETRVCRKDTMRNSPSYNNTPNNDESSRSISTWEDLTTRFLAQFFPLGMTAKLRNDILMFQQHQGNLLLKHGLHFKTYYQISPTSMASIYGLIQRLMEAHLAPKQPVQMKKITSSCEIYSGPYDTQYCMENPEQAFVNYVSLRSNELGDKVREEENVKPNATEYNGHEMTAKAEEKVKEESEDEFEEEIEEEEEEDVEYLDTFPSLEELRYHEWILKYPKPSWVNAKIRTESLNNMKFSCMIGHFVKKQAYIDLESPINVILLLHYNWNKSDTTSIIDHDLGAVYLMKRSMEVLRKVSWIFLRTI